MRTQHKNRRTVYIGSPASVRQPEQTESSTETTQAETARNAIKEFRNYLYENNDGEKREHVKKMHRLFYEADIGERSVHSALTKSYLTAIVSSKRKTFFQDKNQVFYKAFAQGLSKRIRLNVDKSIDAILNYINLATQHKKWGTFFSALPTSVAKFKTTLESIRNVKNNQKKEDALEEVLNKGVALSRDLKIRPSFTTTFYKNMRNLLVFDVFQPEKSKEKDKHHVDLYEESLYSSEDEQRFVV